MVSKGALHNIQIGRYIAQLEEKLRRLATCRQSSRRLIVQVLLVIGFMAAVTT